MREIAKLLLVSVVAAIVGAVVQEAVHAPSPVPTLRIVPASANRAVCPTCGGLSHCWRPARLDWFRSWRRGEWVVCPTCGGTGTVPVQNPRK
jgi:hypothetical protein